MKAIDITDKTMCTGCRTCEMLCPAGAIRMIEDEEGFRFPQVNGDLCIDCGLCTRHCPQLNTLPESDRLPSPEVFAAYAKDGDIVMSSSSGGLFTVLAEQVLKEDGVVFGAAYMENFEVCHVCVSKSEDLEKLRRSKYVASDPRDTFKQVKQLLSEERKVLYTGCPCQIAGLRAYLNKSYDNLLTIDLVCHGTPSQKIFNKYLGWLTNRLKGDIESINFRSKNHISGHSAMIKTKEGRVYTCNYGNDPYYSAFHSGSINRECCYVCHYSKTHRVGDITLGDYWGIEIMHPSFFSRNGVSLVILNTLIGKIEFQKIIDKIEFISLEMEKATKYNKNLYRSNTRPEDRNIKYKNINNLNDYEFTCQNLHIPIKTRIKNQIKTIMPKSVKSFIKKLLLNMELIQ